MDDDLIITKRESAALIKAASQEVPVTITIVDEELHLPDISENKWARAAILASRKFQ